VDITGLDSDDFHRAITVDDRDQWDYRRLAGETGRSVERIRKWVANAYALDRGEEVTDKTFIIPDGLIGDSPWWYAARARAALIDPAMGVMTRDGRAIPYQQRGRLPGAVDLAPRSGWAQAPARDSAPALLAEYRKLTNRRRDPMSDRRARAELCARHTLNRLQLAYRLKRALAAEQGSRAPEVDNASLLEQYLALAGQHMDKGLSVRAADNRARESLIEQTGLTRRQLAARISAARKTS
jgi:hypothetical protein